MTRAAAGALRLATLAPEELVGALCHEVGNLLAGIRLSASFAAEPEAAADIERLSLQAASLVQLVRPLLAPAASRRRVVEPGEVLAALSRGLELDPVLRVSAARGVPDLKVDPAGLHHLLRSLVIAEVGASREDAEPEVRVRARRDERGVLFLLESRSRPLEPPVEGSGLPQRGRRLLLEVGAAFARRHRGRLGAFPRRGGLRVELAFPAA